MAIEAGDYVQLTPRERPHHDPVDAWWKVLNVSDFGLDVVYPANRRLNLVRRGVSPDRVCAHRRENEPA